MDAFDAGRGRLADPDVGGDLPLIEPREAAEAGQFPDQLLLGQRWATSDAHEVILLK